jgi:signal transduction histidine kinase/DNA-binding NarL/FixJ family response regulator
MTRWPMSTVEPPRFSQRLGVRLATLLGMGAALSALLATAAMLAMAWYFADQDNRDEAQQVARSLAFALQAPVSFEDAQGIREAVAVLQARPQIQSAWVHDGAGRLLYAFGDVQPPAAEGSGSLAQGWLRVEVPIVAGAARDTVGRVRLQVNLQDARRKLRVQAMAAAAAGLLAATLALLLSQRLARRISVPMVRLAATAAKITREQNYALRLPAGGSDELGVAVNAFNHMLDEIGQRGTALLSMNHQLQHQADLAQAAQARAESASQAKTRFLANMSHELRSPLNGVIGAAQLLQAQGADPARRAELVEIIRTSGSNLLGLIEHVLDLARIEAGALVLQPRDFNLLDCLDAAVLSSAPLASAKGLRLSCRVDPDLDPWRHGDDVRLRQMVLNLLGNAVKFTAQGDVSVDVRPLGAADRLQIQIRDTGIGMAPEALDTIFEPFQQADASTTRRFGGSGLGLAICQELARLMDGAVSAQSIPGVGSCFTLDLPLPLARQAQAADAPLGLRVAWCEPHEPSAKALAALLQRLGCEAQRCQDVDTLRAFVEVPDHAGRPPWFIVAVDAEAGRQLLGAAWGWLDPCRVLPVDVASDAPAAPMRHALGLPQAMSRPLLRQALASRLIAQAPGSPVASVADPALPGAGTTAARVLLVEDDAINQAVVRSMLEHAGLACTVASNGALALQVLVTAPFDLVLMDWQMPDMDGLEATRRLRRGEAGERNRTVPVVALTANAFAEDRDACLAAGMNDFISKPVLAAHLVAVVRRWTRRDAWPAVALAGQALPDASDAEGADAAAQADDTPVHDPAVLGRLPMVADGSDPQYVQRQQALFDRTTTESLAALEQAIAAADLVAVQRGFHSLKSSAGQVGALAMAAEAARSEAALRRGEPAAGTLLPMLQRLRAAHSRFAAAVAAHRAG